MSNHYLHIVRRFRDTKVLVIGDAIRDYYHFGRVDRISPEAPVPIFIEDHNKFEVRRGGADNVAHQLEVLGCHVGTFFTSARSIKSRYMVGHHQVFRIDDDASEECDSSHVPRIKDFDVIVLSDYAKGFLTDELCKLVISISKNDGIPVVVDPKGSSWDKYKGADVICPNEKEWLAVGLEQPEGTTIVAKHGEKGLAVVTRKSEVQTANLLPARAKHVFDVTGAGDVVVALVAATIAAGFTVQDGAFLGNVAAGHVVTEIGTTVCSLEKLEELLAE